MLTSIQKAKKDKEDIVYPWTREQEELLAEWSEKATCYRWLHSRSEKSYRARNYLFTIPVIILSTLTGTANFAMDSFVPEDNKQIAMAVVGSVNIFAGILSTLQNFLRYAELMESHRSSEVQWSKFGRNIAVELAIDPRRRKSASDFLKISRAEYDRLIEQSPPIDDTIIKSFKTTFKNIKIKIPDMCNGLDKCKIFEVSPDDKLETMMAHAATKLLQNKDKKPVRKWEINDIPAEHHQPYSKPESAQDESKRELDALKNISRVSAFREQVKLHEESSESKVDILSLVAMVPVPDVEMGPDVDAEDDEAEEEAEEEVEEEADGDSVGEDDEAEVEEAEVEDESDESDSLDGNEHVNP